MTEHRLAQIAPSDAALLPRFGLKKVGHPAEGREPILTAQRAMRSRSLLFRASLGPALLAPLIPRAFRSRPRVHLCANVGNTVPYRRVLYGRVSRSGLMTQRMQM